MVTQATKDNTLEFFGVKSPNLKKIAAGLLLGRQLRPVSLSRDPAEIEGGDLESDQREGRGERDGDEREIERRLR